MVSETGQSWCKNRAPQCQVSKFPAVTGQGSASPVLRGWSQERKGQVSVWLQTVPTLSRHSLSSSFLRHSQLVSRFLLLQFHPLSLSLTLRYLSRCMHIDHPIFVSCSALDSFSFPTAAAHPPHDFAGVLTGSSISTWTYGKLVETPLGPVFQGGGISSAFSGARSIGRNWTGYKLDKVKLNFWISY